ncbi:MAG: restriction endonuclease subunit S [Bacteroidales bacterium]|nr:restriction endonuclease subunit S [Bacteroidales bacterium]
MSWEEIEISEVLTQVKTKINIVDSQEYKLVTISNTGIIKLRKITKGSTIKSKTALKIQKGNFIYSRLSVHNGAFGIIPNELDEAIVTTEMPSFKIENKIISGFLLYSLKLPHFQFQLKQLTKGVGRTRVKEKTFLKLKIHFPSLREQQSLLNQFQLSEGISKSTNTELTHQLDLVKQLRQAFLREAMQGKLVPQNPNDLPDRQAGEPASKLFAKIKAEKEKLIKEKKIKKQKPLPPITKEEIPFEIPKNWVWCRLGELAYITSGSTPAHSAFVNEGIPYLKMYNLRNQKIDFFHKPQYIKEEVHNGQLKRCRAFPGDIIMNIVGPPLGKIAIIPSDLPQCNFNQAAVLIRPFFKELNVFIFWYLNEMSEINSIDTKGVAGQNNISVTQSHNMRIPFPPLSEQHRIVAKLDKLMKYCDNLEESIKSSQQQNDLLLQQVLREALGPNERKDENISKIYLTKENKHSIAAEINEQYKTKSIISLRKKDIYFRRVVLAAEIASQLHDQPTFGHVKLQKLVYLCEQISEMKLHSNYSKQAAGPYDRKFMHSIDSEFNRQKWFEVKQESVNRITKYIYTPFVHIHKYKKYYNNYYSEYDKDIQSLISTFKIATSKQIELIATLYACWEDINVKKENFSYDRLVKDFYNWSEEKGKFKEENVRNAIEWMKEKGIKPK